jgi:vancomycin resistance protein YoaR
MVNLQMQAVEPSYTAENFRNAQSLLGRFYTFYQGDEESPRSINIRLSAAGINNSVVYPDEIFSTREAVGPSTAERGYAMAEVIVAGRLVEDYGGGICQVASTLYNALLFAELRITERANHSVRVYYLDPGFDAAIAGDYMDLKFKNTSGNPVLVVAQAQDGLLEVRIYGYETRPANRDLAFVSESVNIEHGYKYELYKIIFIDGEQMERVKVNTSFYKPVPEDVPTG